MRHSQKPEVRALHIWLNRTFPRTGRCENCARRRRTEYASIEHRYSRWRHDWFELCRTCHKRFDGEVGETHYNRQKTHCPNGHPYTPENTRIGSRGFRECWTCRRAQQRAYEQEHLAAINAARVKRDFRTRRTPNPAASGEES